MDTKELFQKAKVLPPQDKILLRLKEVKTDEDNLSLLKTQFYENIRDGEEVSYEEYTSLSSCYEKIHHAAIEREIPSTKKLREEYGFITDICECLNIPHTYSQDAQISESRIKNKMLRLSKILAEARRKLGLSHLHMSNYVSVLKSLKEFFAKWSGFEIKLLSSNKGKAPAA